MIIDIFIKIKLNSRNIKRLKQLGYVGNIGEVVEILVEHISNGSTAKIKVKCDLCESEKIVIFSNYKKFTKNGLYYCKDCKSIKTKKTCLLKYGVENPFQDPEVRQKYKNTCIKKYGVENVFQDEDIKNKIKKTCLNKYGAVSYTKTKEYIEKTKETKKLKYDNESFINIEKIKETCLEKYGFNSYMKTDNFINIRNLHNFENRDKNLKKQKITNLHKYGVENVFQDEGIKNKIKKTCLERYGVEYPAQNEFIFLRSQKSRFKMEKYKDSKLFYQGSYEKDFLDKYYDKIKIIKAKSVKYIFNKKEHIYFPDFFLPDFNTIIEIKSKYTFNAEYEQNIAKKDACLKNNQNYLFLIDKNYQQLENLWKT